MNKSIILAFAGLCLALSIVSCDSSVDRVIDEMAKDFNKQCPVMITDSLRIDNMKGLQGKRVQCNYTLFGSETIFDAESKKRMESALIQSIKTSPGMQFFRENKATFEYNYNDKNGKLLISIEITPDRYK